MGIFYHKIRLSITSLIYQYFLKHLQINSILVMILILNINLIYCDFLSKIFKSFAILIYFIIKYILHDANFIFL